VFFSLTSESYLDSGKSSTFRRCAHYQVFLFLQIGKPCFCQGSPITTGIVLVYLVHSLPFYFQVLIFLYFLTFISYYVCVIFGTATSIPFVGLLVSFNHRYRMICVLVSACLSWSRSSTGRWPRFQPLGLVCRTSYLLSCWFCSFSICYGEVLLLVRCYTRPCKGLPSFLLTESMRSLCEQVSRPSLHIQHFESFAYKVSQGPKPWLPSHVHGCNEHLRKAQN